MFHYDATGSVIHLVNTNITVGLLPVDGQGLLGGAAEQGRGRVSRVTKGLFFSWVNPHLPTSTHFNLLQSISTHLKKNINFNPL